MWLHSNDFLTHYFAPFHSQLRGDWGWVLGYVHRTRRTGWATVHIFHAPTLDILQILRVESKEEISEVRVDS